MSPGRAKFGSADLCLVLHRSAICKCLLKHAHLNAGFLDCCGSATFIAKHAVFICGQTVLCFLVCKPYGWWNLKTSFYFLIKQNIDNFLINLDPILILCVNPKDSGYIVCKPNLFNV